MFFQTGDDFWKYAEKIVEGKEISARCKKCLRIIKMTGNSRTAMLRHLMSVHGIDVKKQADAGTSKEIQEDPDSSWHFRDFPKEIVDHKHFCRLCISDERNQPKFQINSTIQKSIFDLRIEVCLFLISK